LDDATIARFQTELAAMGYKFQFITLAGFHALNLSMFELAQGYEAAKHQRFVGTGYFDMVTQVIASGNASTTALAGSTETEQFAPSEHTRTPIPMPQRERTRVRV